MRRLIINLHSVTPVDVEVESPGKKVRTKKKIFNTVNYLVKNDVDIADRLYQHRFNTKSHKLSFCK